MACKENAVCMVDAHHLASVIRSRNEKVLIIDSRSFLEYNDYHIVGATNVCCSKLVKRRLQQDKVSVRDFLLHSCHIEVDESSDIIVYDQSSFSAASVALDSFLHVLLQKLVHVFRRVLLLSGGFLEFQSCYRDLCEDKSRRCPALTSLSQPCLPTTNVGPTRILPFLYLGSQQDANNKELLLDHNISYEVNVSTNCPKPDFIQDSHFLRLPVNDSYGEKLLPYFVKATQFIDKVRESNCCVLVHCLAGISRSPTVAIAYVMRHLKMTFDDAFRYVKSKRASISPNFNFLGQLLEYERQLRAEEVLDSSIGDISTAPVTRCALGLVSGVNVKNLPCGLGGRERLSRSISLSLSLKSPLETVPSSPDQSPIEEVDDSVDRGIIGGQQQPASLIQQADLSPTTALARLTFDAMETDQQSEELKESGHSFIVVSQRKHTESRSLRLREQRLTESHFYSNKQTTESRMILTVSKRVSQSSPSLPLPLPPMSLARNQMHQRWKEPANQLLHPPHPHSPSHCSEISVRIEKSEGSAPEEEEQVQVRPRGPLLQQRPHSDGPHLFRNRRRPSYAPSEASSTLSDEMLLPPTPSSPPPVHSLLNPQDWTYARSDSVTTSGLGSEVSDSDTRADDMLSLCGSVRFGWQSEETESLPPDDGVFTESAPGTTRSSSPQPSPPPQAPTRSRPRPSSLLGITPVRETDWKPTASDEPFCIRRPRPTSLNPLCSPIHPGVTLHSPGVHSADESGPQSNATEAAVKEMDFSATDEEQHPDSATIFRLWRQREAALEQDSSRSESHAPLVVRRRSKETPQPLSVRYSEKRKSSEIPEEASSSAAKASSVSEKRRSTRDGEGESSVGSPVSAAEVSDGGLLYRVKSCPGIVDQVESSQNSQPQPNDMDDQLLRSIHLELQLSESREETRVQLRVRSQSRVSQTQLQQHRYSCGALEDHQRQMATGSTEQSALCSPCGSRHNSNPSLNCNGYSFIQVQ